MMRSAPWELLVALLILGGLTVLYAGLARDGLPAPGGLAGHTLGIVGFTLMLATEFLYTLRKRWHGFNVGTMRTWLSLHVVTGIVGPYLVLLHSAGRFNGLAGLVSLLTVVMVASGFVGRFIYTAAPRNLDGSELDAAGLESRLVRIEHDLNQLGVTRIPELATVTAQHAPMGWHAVLGRHWLRRRYALRVREQTRRLKPAELGRRIEGLLIERYNLWLQIDCLLATRRVLALWHLFHVPLGGVLFSLAFLHVGGALYYATFLK